MKLTYSVAILDGASIEIEIENSPLSIRQSEDSELKMTVESTLSNPDQIEKFKNIADPTELLKEIFNVSGLKSSKVTVEIDEDELEPYMERGWNRNFHFTIEVPKNSKILAENENGPLDVQNIEQEISLTTENGPIRVKDCSGVLYLQAENGPVDVSEHNGNISVQMENGPVKVNDCKGNEITIEIENGPVVFKNSEFPTVNIKGENGPTRVDIPQLESGDYNVETEHGSIQINIASGNHYDITAENEIGAIILQLSQTSQILENEQDEDSKRVHIKEGEGNLKINIKSETGTIKVKDESSSDQEFRFEFKGIPTDFNEEISNITNFATNLANQISQSVSVALGKVVKKINVPDMERKLDIERVSEKIQKMGEKIQKAVDPDFEIPEPPEPPDVHEKEGKLKILELLEKGKITADEATMLLGALKSKD